LCAEQCSGFLSVSKLLIHQLTGLVKITRVTSYLANSRYSSSYRERLRFRDHFSQLAMSLSTDLISSINACNQLLQDPEEFRRQFICWVMEKYSIWHLHEDQSALLLFPQYMWGTIPGGQQLPTITVTTTEGETLFLHENLEFRNLVSRSWRRIGTQSPKA